MDEVTQKCRQFAVEMNMYALRHTRSDVITKFEQTYDPDRRARVSEGFLQEQGQAMDLNLLTSRIEEAVRSVLNFEPLATDRFNYRVGK